MRTMSEKMSIVKDYFAEVTPPVQVVPLANRLGIRVYNVPWPSSISGKIQKDSERGGSSGFAIFVNKDHPPTRRRFTIAHEIAHFVLHEEQIGDGIFDDAMYRSGLPDKVEVQANALAADILMPRKMIVDALESYGADAKRLSSLFDVSEQAMSIRLSVLRVPVF